MKESILKRSVVQNGADSVAVFREKGLVHRIEPIPVIQQISLFNFQRGKTKIFKLDERLTKDYEILGVHADVPEDDGDADEVAKNAGDMPIVGISARIFSGKKAVSNLRLTFSNFPIYMNRLYINHRDVWHIRVTRNVTSITFMCRPVSMEQPIVFP